MRQHWAATVHRALPEWQWPALLGMPWGTARSNAASAVCSRCGGACTGACGRAVQVVGWGVRFCQFLESFRGGGSTRQPQLTEPCQCVSGQPWVCHGALQGQMQTLLCAAGVGGDELGAAVQVICEGCGFAGLWRVPGEEAALGNHIVHSPASLRVASPGHSMGNCKVKGSLRSLQQVWWGLHWGLRQRCWAGGWWGVRFCRFKEISRG